MADRELYKLTRYMLHIANIDDFTILSHKVMYFDLALYLTLIPRAELEERFARFTSLMTSDHVPSL